MPPFLSMDHGIGRGTGMEDSIGIHIDEVVKVLGVLTCHYITRPVWIRKSVKEGLKRSLKQLNEWILGYL